MTMLICNILSILDVIGKVAYGAGRATAAVIAANDDVEAAGGRWRSKY